MKSRHVLAALIGASLLALALASCSLASVSVDQRLATFLSDLNAADRNNLVYQNFHPTQTTEYGALKNSGLSGFDTAYPSPSGTNYAFSTVDETSPSAGVIVQVTAGPTSGSSLVPPNFYLKLTMATTGDSDWRIVSVSDSNINGGYSAPRFY